MRRTARTNEQIKTEDKLKAYSQVQRFSPVVVFIFQHGIDIERTEYNCSLIQAVGDGAQTAVLLYPLYLTMDFFVPAPFYSGSAVFGKKEQYNLDIQSVHHSFKVLHSRTWKNRSGPDQVLKLDPKVGPIQFQMNINTSHFTLFFFFNKNLDKIQIQSAEIKYTP